MTLNEIYLSSLPNLADSELGNMAAKIALQNFDYRYGTLLFFNTTLYCGVEMFLRVFNNNIFISSGIINSIFIKRSQQFVIFGSDDTDLEILLETLKELEIKSNRKFIFVCQSQISNDCDEKKMTSLFWEYRIVDAVLVKSKEQALGYTYFPISNGECDNVEPVQISSSNCSEHLTTTNGKIFGMKLKKLNFCPLVVSTFVQEPYMNFTNGEPVGSDGELIGVISYALNTSINIMLPHRGDGWGFRSKNGTWMGSLADIDEELANISMTSAALTLTRFSDFHMSCSYYASHVVWVTHTAALQNEALKLLHPFTYSTRITLIVSYLLVLLCAFIIRIDKCSFICPSTELDRPLRSMFFYSWMICMGQSLIKLPTKSTWLHITFLWIYYCFIIRTVYQVYLISSLKATLYEDQIDSIEDAMKANYPFGGGPALQDYYIDYPAVYNNWVNVDAGDMIPTILAISKGKKFVLAMNGDTAKIAIKKYKINIHILSQKIVSSPSVIFFKKYSPLIESVNLALSRLTAAGLPEMLNKKYTSVKTDKNKNEGSHETLKLVHFTTCYLVLLVGWILSAVFFLLEVYFGRIYKHRILIFI